MKVIIATPFYEIKAYSPYIICLLESIKVLQAIGIEYDYFELSGDSYVDRAKNSLVHRFLESDATHLFMIDSDLAWDIAGFARVIRAGAEGAEVVGGAYPNKNNWDEFGCIPLSEDGYFIGVEKGNMRLLEMWGIPGGFILYSRKAFERTRSSLKSYTDLVNNTTYLECFKCNIETNGTRIGEDIYFQQRYRECGGKVFLEPDISFQHFGIKGWEGNYDQFLRQKPGGPDSHFRIGELRAEHSGETAYIIGKGASLQYLKKEDIGEGIIIALNEAIVKVEELNLPNKTYSMQKDLGDFPEPKTATLLVHFRESNDAHKDYKPRYVFDCVKDFNLKQDSFSALVAGEIAKLMGCKKLVFVSCDVCANGGVQTCVPNTDGTYDLTDKHAHNLMIQKHNLIHYLNNAFIPVEWVTPESNEIKENAAW